MRIISGTAQVDEFYKIDWNTIELDLGIRKYWGEKVQFFIGTGLAIAEGELDLDFADDVDVEIIANGRGEPPVIEPGGLILKETVSDTDFGLWADIGFVWRAGGHFNIGVDVRYSSVNVDFTFEDDEPDDVPIRFPTGGVQVGLFLGGKW